MRFSSLCIIEFFRDVEVSLRLGIIKVGYLFFIFCSECRFNMDIKWEDKFIGVIVV